MVAIFFIYSTPDWIRSNPKSKQAFLSDLIRGWTKESYPTKCDLNRGQTKDSYPTEYDLVRDRNKHSYSIFSGSNLGFLYDWIRSSPSLNQRNLSNWFQTNPRPVYRFQWDWFWPNPRSLEISTDCDWIQDQWKLKVLQKENKNRYSLFNLSE